MYFSINMYPLKIYFRHKYKSELSGDFVKLLALKNICTKIMAHATLEQTRIRDFRNLIFKGHIPGRYELYFILSLFLDKYGEILFFFCFLFSKVKIWKKCKTVIIENKKNCENYRWLKMVFIYQLRNLWQLNILANYVFLRQHDGTLTVNDTLFWNTQRDQRSC